jgi:RNA polymerase sigma-70 factor (ECF subfamily)
MVKKAGTAAPIRRRPTPKTNGRSRVGEHSTGGPAGAQHNHRSDAVDARATRDRELVDRAVALAKRGDHEGIRFIYSTYSGDVFRFVRSIVGDEHEAEDVTQTVFLKLMRVISKYERGTVPFTAWLMRVARNAAIDHLRERRPVPVEEIRGQSTPDAIDDNLERLMELRDAMAGLQDEQREVVLLRHVQGLAPGEIASRLGKSEGAVHGLHHRGRRAVQARLRERGMAPVTR